MSDTFEADGTRVPFRPGDTVLEALLRAGQHPTGGGCLCCAGDCPHCLVVVDGEAYARSCQLPARSGLDVRLAHADGNTPPLQGGSPSASRSETGEAAAQHAFADVVVVGQGRAGRAAAERARGESKSVLTLDAQAGQDVVGVYPGPLVVARTLAGMLHVRPEQELVLAPGSAEIQPAVPGAHLRGLLTSRAADRLHQAGLDLGHVVAVGAQPVHCEAEAALGDLVRFEPKDDAPDRLGAVVMRQGGKEVRFACDTASLGLGWSPRAGLSRMARHVVGNVKLETLGSAAEAGDLPTCPPEGTVCPCSQVSVADLERVWNAGFRELELMKRATLAGTGTCQGSCCTPYLRSFIQEHGAELQEPFTARPPVRQPTVEEVAAGAHHHPTARTPLHTEHEALGATFERSGGWWRPWTYGDPNEPLHRPEYDAVREAVSVCDVGTLGKFRVTGPDALAFLELVFPTRIATLKEGRLRYVLLLDERGYVLDDGIVARDGNELLVCFTSGGASFAEMWLRDWVESRPFDARILNETWSLGAINVTGPRAAELLHRLGAGPLPKFGTHGQLDVAGVSCRAYRMSFTGELSYELHHAAADSVALWRKLLEAGEDLGIRPHGLQTLLGLRLEKGHVIVGKDTDYDSTLRRIDHEWAAHLESGDFVGRHATVRTNAIPLNRRLAALEMESPAPVEGAVIWRAPTDGGAPEQSDYAGYTTSCFDSPALGKVVALGWVRQELVDADAALLIDGRPARLTSLPFYDPKGARAKVSVDAPDGTSEPATATAPSSTPLEITRVVAAAERLDGLAAAVTDDIEVELPDDESLAIPAAYRVLRIADDEALVLGLPPTLDPGALVLRETGLALRFARAEESTELLAANCRWKIPAARPAFAQGALADIPVKLLLLSRGTLLFVPSPFADDFDERVPTAAIAPPEHEA